MSETEDVPLHLGQLCWKHLARVTEPEGLDYELKYLNSVRSYDQMSGITETRHTDTHTDT